MVLLDIRDILFSEFSSYHPKTPIKVSVEGGLRSGWMIGTYENMVETVFSQNLYVFEEGLGENVNEDEVRVWDVGCLYALDITSFSKKIGDHSYVSSDGKERLYITEPNDEEKAALGCPNNLTNNAVPMLSYRYFWSEFGGETQYRIDSYHDLELKMLMTYFRNLQDGFGQMKHRLSAWLDVHPNLEPVIRNLIECRFEISGNPDNIFGLANHTVTKHEITLGDLSGGATIYTQERTAIIKSLRARLDELEQIYEEVTNMNV